MRAGCFTLSIFLVSYDYYCSLSLPRFAKGWSVIVAFSGNTCLLNHIHEYLYASLKLYSN